MHILLPPCTKDRRCLLWHHVGATCGRPRETPPLSDIGKIVDDEINKISVIYENVIIDKYVIMPNHIHMIIVLTENGRPQVAPTIPRIMQQFKGSISKKVGYSIWQKSYHDHVVRNELEYLEIWDYIETNPLRWEEDTYYANS